jgi:molybdenum cofactor cytidylyltransferase
MGTDAVHGVLLAAGASERMGRHKLLMAVDGKTVFETTLHNHMESSLGGVCAVLPGWIEGFKEIAARAAHPRVVFIETGGPCEMSESLKSGWSWARENTDSRGIMISLADQPLVSPGTIDLLVKAYLASDKAFCVPVYHGRRGHPVIIGREFDGEVMKLTGDRGAREILAAWPDLVLEIGVGSDEVLVDIDRIEDIHVIRSRLEAHG